MCGQVTRSAARGVEKKSGIYFTMKGARTLWERHT